MRSPQVYEFVRLKLSQRETVGDLKTVGQRADLLIGVGDHDVPQAGGRARDRPGADHDAELAYVDHVG